MDGRIVKLDVTNFKRLRHVTIKAQPYVNIVGGRNAQGKTSVLDAIAAALGGKRMMPAEPIRKGQKKAEIVVDLGELVVERVQTAKTDRLVVKNANGEIAKSPQALLDQLWSDRTIDPAAFMRMSPADQATKVMAVVGLDFADLNAEREAIYNERRDVNRDLAQAAAVRGQMLVHEDAPTDEVSFGEIVRELHDAEARNRANDAERREAERAVEELAKAEEAEEKNQAEIDELENRLIELRQEQRGLKGLTQTAEADLKRQEQVVAALADVDTAPIIKRMNDAEQTNEQVRANKAAWAQEETVRGLSDKTDSLTERLEAIDEEKARRLAEAKFPVEGMTFSNEGLRLNGILFEQASTAEKWPVSVAMGLAMHPEIKVLLVREGEKLDSTNGAVLAKLAVQNELQLWIEDCRAGADEATVIIEDGQVVADNK